MDEDSAGKSLRPRSCDDSSSLSSRPMTFNELLIQQVRAHPELYDQQHRVCTDNGERNLIWENIAGRIDETVSGEFAKKRWLQMRDRYRKELKSALKSGIIPKWPYFEKLSWLDPYLKDNKPGSISSSFIGQGQGFNVNTDDDETPSVVDHGGDLIDFSNYSNLTASTLLENIMAVSGSFGHHHSHSHHHHQLSDMKTTMSKPSGEFSPDSAVASTSEDGDNRVPSVNADRSDSGDPHGQGQDSSQTQNHLLFGSSTAAGLLMKLEAINAAASAFSEQHKTPLDQKLLDAFRHSNSSSPPPRPARIRNPPYLVRRGGGLKVKPSMRRGDSGLPLCDSPRSISESSTSDSSRMLKSEKEILLEEFSGKEWATDEDMLFARLVVVRLKKFAAKERRGIRARINELIDEKEEEIEKVKKPPMLK